MDDLELARGYARHLRAKAVRAKLSPELQEIVTALDVMEIISAANRTPIEDLPPTAPTVSHPEWIRITKKAFGIVRDKHKPGTVVKPDSWNWHHFDDLPTAGEWIPRIGTTPVFAGEWEPAEPLEGRVEE
jgi:hypothetical protein